MAGESLNDKQNAAYTADANDMPAGAVRVVGTVSTTGGSSSSPEVQPVSITSGFPVVQPVSITSGFPVTQPVSVADGSDVVEGSTADAAIITDAAGTVSGKLRGFIKILADVWDPINHWIKISVSSSSIIQPVSITSGFPLIQPVSITTGFPSVQPVSISSGVPLIVNPGNLLTANIIQFATGTVLTGPGPSGVGVPRVTLSNDSMVRLTDGTTTGLIIAGTNALKTDLSSVAGTVVETARAGIQRVGLTGATGVALDAATGTAVPQNALMVGGRVATSNPKASTNALLVQPMYDKVGRQVTVPGHIRELVSSTHVIVRGNTANTTIIPSGGLGVYNDLASLTITTTFTTIGFLIIKNGTATSIFVNYPNSNAAPSAPLVLFFQPPIPQPTADTAWTVTQSSATMAVNYSTVFIKNV